MPRDFYNSLDTVNLGPENFREDLEFDQDGKLEGLTDALNATADISNLFVLENFERQNKQAQDQEDELYTKARELKRGIYEAGIAGDSKTELQFQAALEDLKKAERQGAITGANGAIRQEALLKNYVNRYPHLEESFRKSYSSTRARAEASKEQFEDPIEAGMDSLIKEATSQGYTVAQWLSIKTAQQDLELQTKRLQMKSMLGQQIEDDVNLEFENNVIPLAVADAQRTLTGLVQYANQKGIEFDGNKFKADFILAGKRAAGQVAARLNDIVKRSPAPDASLSRTFIDDKRREVEKVYEDIVASGVFDSYDTLSSMERGLKIGSIQGLKELAKFSPLLAELVRLNPKEGYELIYKDFNKIFEEYKKGRTDFAKILIQNNPNGLDAARVKYQLDVINRWGGKELAADYRSFVEDGAPPAPTGDPDVDAGKVSILAQTVLGSPSTTSQQKTQAVRGALEAEKLNSKEFIGPSPVWFRNPVRLNALRNNPEAAKIMDDEIESSAAAAAQAIAANVQAQSELYFSPRYEEEPDNEPWKIYKSPIGFGVGGPFELAGFAQNPDGSRKAPKSGGYRVAAGGTGARAAFVSPVANHVQALNDMYWTYRSIHGLTEANRWAEQVLAASAGSTAERMEGVFKDANTGQVFQRDQEGNMVELKAAGEKLDANPEIADQ